MPFYLKTRSRSGHVAIEMDDQRIDKFPHTSRPHYHLTIFIRYSTVRCWQLVPLNHS